MFFRFSFTFLICCCFSLPSWGAEASSMLPASLSLKTALQRAITHSSALHIAQLQEQDIHWNQQQLRTSQDPKASIKGQISDDRTPSSSPFAPVQNNIAFIQGNITQPLEHGDTLTLSAQYTRAHSSYSSTIPRSFQSTMNPSYQQQIDLIYRYPLLKGHDNAAYLNQLQQLTHNQEALRWQRLAQREQIAAQVGQLYFQLAANQVAITLSQDALKRSQRMLVYQQKREYLGLVERSDRLATKALLAARQADVVNAQNTYRNTQTILNRLMQQPYNTPIMPIIPSPNGAKFSSLDTLIQQAEHNRPIFHALQAQIQAAQAQLRLAQNNDQAQLDVVGQIGTRSLSGTAGQTLVQGFSLKDRYIALSMEWSDNISQKDMHSSIRKAALQSERIQLQQQQTRDDTITELSKAITQWYNATQTEQALQYQQSIEQMKFREDMRRYREGRSDTSTIIQSEGALQQVSLQTSLQNIQRQQALFRIQLLTGTWTKLLH